MVGCGTSYHAGVFASYIFKDLCEFNTVQVFEGGEFSILDIPKTGQTACILLSQSGETKDIHNSIPFLKERGIFILGVINVVDSMIARETDCTLYINAGREVGVASTKSYMNQTILLSKIAIWFSETNDWGTEEKRNGYKQCLSRVPQDIKNTLEICEAMLPTQVSSLNKENLFIIGKEKGFAVAIEGALKIKEMTYIHAEGFSSSSLKHGPFSLLNKNTPVVIIGLKNKLYNKLESSINEITSRSSPVFLITDDIHYTKDNFVVIPNNKYFGELLCIIPIQIISYYISIERNINCDKPKNLAKICTVH